MREKVEFPANVPVEVALAFATGKRGTNDNGDYWMYTTTNDRVFFASAALDAKIQEQTPCAFERLVICLKKLNNRSIWEVRRVDPMPPQPAGQDSRSAAGGAHGQHQTAPASNGSTNGHHPPPPPPPPAAPPAPRPAAPSLMTGQGQGMLEQFISVYEVLVAVENYAALKGRPVSFTSEDFRSTAISCYIQQSKGGR